MTRRQLTATRHDGRDKVVEYFTDDQHADCERRRLQLVSDGYHVELYRIVVVESWRLEFAGDRDDVAAGRGWRGGACAPELAKTEPAAVV